MKVMKWTLAVAIAGALTACSSVPDVDDETTANSDQATNPTEMEKGWCTFDDGKTEAPEFFCSGEIDGFAVTGRGSAPKSAAGMNYMVEQAALAARGELARNIRTEVNTMVKNYLETTGVVSSESVDRAASSTSESLTSETLVGSRIVRRIVGPEGEVYVWVAVDEENLVSSAQHAIRTSMSNDQAAWQQFQAEKSHQEMADKITDLRNRRGE